jgi:hypothetical protein
MQESGISFYGSVQNIMSFHISSELMQTKVHGNLILPHVLKGCEFASLIKECT